MEVATSTVQVWAAPIEGLSRLLSRHPHIEWMGEASSGIRFQQGAWERRIEADRPDLPIKGLIELMDNNPIVCADEMSVPGPASTLALIALGPLLRNRPKAAEFAWTESMAPGVRVQARVGQSLWLNRSYPAQKWGIVRLFSEAKRTPVGERRVKCAWVFTQMLGTRTLSFMAYAEFEFGSGVAFEPALFSELKLPETLR